MNSVDACVWVNLKASNFIYLFLLCWKYEPCLGMNLKHLTYFKCSELVSLIYLFLSSLQFDLVSLHQSKIPFYSHLFLFFREPNFYPDCFYSYKCPTFYPVSTLFLCLMERNVLPSVHIYSMLKGYLFIFSLHFFNFSFSITKQ